MGLYHLTATPGLIPDGDQKHLENVFFRAIAVQGDDTRKWWVINDGTLAGLFSRIIPRNHAEEILTLLGKGSLITFPETYSAEQLLPIGFPQDPV